MRCLCWIIAVVIQPACLITMFISADELVGGGDRGIRHAAARIQIRAYLRGLQLYKNDVGAFPTTEQGLAALRSNPGVAGWNGPYLARDINPDPWGRAYVYQSKAGEIELLSLGLDGRPGGEGLYADISSRTLDQPTHRGKYSWGTVCAISSLGFFWYPFLPGILRRLNAKWPVRRS